MLSVTIKLDGDIVTMGKRVDIACLDGPAYTEVLDKVDMRSVDFIENLRGPVRRPVVDDEVVVGGFGQATCNRPDGLLLIVGRNNEENPPPSNSSCFGYQHAFPANSLSDTGSACIFRCGPFSTSAPPSERRKRRKTEYFDAPTGQQSQAAAPYSSGRTSELWTLRSLSGGGVM